MPWARTILFGVSFETGIRCQLCRGLKTDAEFAIEEFKTSQCGHPVSKF